MNFWIKSKPIDISYFGFLIIKVFTFLVNVPIVKLIDAWPKCLCSPLLEEILVEWLWILFKFKILKIFALIHEILAPLLKIALNIWLLIETLNFISGKHLSQSIRLNQWHWYRSQTLNYYYSQLD